jgi:hypothetical protein
VASRVVIQLISDLSGVEIPEGKGQTIEFSYRGADYSIDLTEKEAAGFDKSIALYLEHASHRGTARGRAKKPSGRAGDAKAVRAWAKAQGIDIPDRGRIPTDIRERFAAVH